MIAYLSSRRASIASLCALLTSIATTVAGLNVIPWKMMGLDHPPLDLLFGHDHAQHIIAVAIVLAALFGLLATFGPSPAPVKNP